VSWALMWKNGSDEKMIRRVNSQPKYTTVDVTSQKRQIAGIFFKQGGRSMKLE
jgi:hypothetical protein